VVLRSAEVADRAGVNVETLRYYERRGLLPEPPRTASGYRCYPEAAVQRVRQVKTLQQLGFSLGDIAGLLDVRVDAPVRCDDLAGHARAKLAVVEDKLAALEQVRDALVEVTRACCAPTHDPSSCARLQPDPIDGQQR
jgi:DNA-binding transcriptional MerR regulator